MSQVRPRGLLAAEEVGVRTRRTATSMETVLTRREEEWPATGPRGSHVAHCKPAHEVGGKSFAGRGARRRTAVDPEQGDPEDRRRRKCR